MPSGHKAFRVSNVQDVELLLMHNKTYAAEYVPPLSGREPITRRNYLWWMQNGQFGANMTLQDRLQRLVAEARRHHCTGEAIRRQGHQREGEGHDGGLSGERQPWGKFFLCFGASQAVLGNGLLFVCDCLAHTKASEYNCGLLRHGQMRSTLRHLGLPEGLLVSAGVTRGEARGLNWNELTNHVRAWHWGRHDYKTWLGWAAASRFRFARGLCDSGTGLQSDEKPKRFDESQNTFRF